MSTLCNLQYYHHHHTLETFPRTLSLPVPQRNLEHQRQLTRTATTTTILAATTTTILAATTSTFQGFRGSVVRAGAFRLCDRGFDIVVSLLCESVVVFFWVLQFPATGKVERAG